MLARRSLVAARRGSAAHAPAGRAPDAGMRRRRRRRRGQRRRRAPGPAAGHGVTDGRRRPPLGGHRPRHRLTRRAPAVRLDAESGHLTHRASLSRVAGRCVKPSGVGSRGSNLTCRGGGPSWRTASAAGCRSASAGRRSNRPRSPPSSDTFRSSTDPSSLGAVYRSCRAAGPPRPLAENAGGTRGAGGHRFASRAVRAVAGRDHLAVLDLVGGLGGRVVGHGVLRRRGERAAIMSLTDMGSSAWPAIASAGASTWTSTLKM